MKTDKSTVFLVDDSLHMRGALRCLFETTKVPVEAFESAEQFLESFHDARPGCLLTDVRMPGMGGLQLLDHMNQIGAPLPIIVFTGHADVPMVLQAMQSGAFAFLEKSATHQQILDHVQRAFAADRERRSREKERAALEKLEAQLTPREREVLDSLVEGTPNKLIARELAISERTLEKHRKKTLAKMKAQSVAELVRMTLPHRA